MQLHYYINGAMAWEISVLDGLGDKVLAGAVGPHHFSSLWWCASPKVMGTAKSCAQRSTALRLTRLSSAVMLL